MNVAAAVGLMYTPISNKQPQKEGNSL
jgi:hypothetical protein